MKLCCPESLVLAATVVFLWISAVECAFPGGRYGAATWYYDNKLWMFGGNGWDETSTSAGLLSDMWTYDPALGMWTFIGGNKVSNVRSSSGAIGAYSATYNPGGSLNMCSWIDESTNAFWLFGGQVGLNPAAYTNAAWKYDPTLSQWAYTFNKTAVGSYGPDLYEIGPRVQHKCVSISSGVYVNGGQGYGTTKDFGYLGDLWYFNTSAPANSSWTLLSGNETLDCQSTLTTDQPSSTDLPGCGTRIAGWSDNEDVYFVSGPENVNLLNQNEVYRYSPGDLSTWTSLSYIELTNRNDSGSVSKDGKAWLFGGYGFAISELRGYLADLYEWNGTNWRYLSGSKAANYLGSFPDQPGTGDSSTYPSGRRLPMMWVDNDGDLWLFGGYSALENGPLNDMWKYSMNDGIWKWMGGSKEANQNGNYTNEVIVPMNPPVSSSNVTVPSANANDSGLSLEAKIAIGVVVPVVVIGVGLLVLLLLLKKRKKQRAKTTTTSTPLPETPAPSNSKYDAIQMKPNGVYSHIGGPNTTKPSTPSIQAVEVPVSDSRMIPYSAITLDQEIGEGSFGKVYVGKLRTTKVAIKVANTKMSQDEFIREANFQLAIPPHPNIVQLLGISIDGPQPLVVLEYCNEGSLDKVLFESDKLRSPAEQIALAEAIARGIDHLHQNNIVHRDLAVRNILLHKGEPKISDFGMSRKLKEVSQVGKTAATIGPLRWMAPEALGKQLYSTKSDVWSFGMMLYEIVAHEEPHANEDLISVAIKIRDEGFVPTIPNDCPPVLREVMQLCWKVNPDERPDMNTICNFLEKTAHK